MSAIPEKNKVETRVETRVENKVYHRLSPSQYLELERKALSRLSFRDETGSTQAGYLVGVHEVLRLVRDGFTTA